MKLWIADFITEVNTIDAFFIAKLQEYVSKFVQLQMEFHRKLETEREESQENAKYVSPIDGKDIELNRPSRMYTN